MSSDGTPVKERLKRYGKVVACYGENLTFTSQTARDIVLELLVDDGVPDRGHRANLFNDDFRMCGLYSGWHSTCNTMMCIDYAATFIKSGQEDPIEKQMQDFLKLEFNG